MRALRLTVLAGVLSLFCGPALANDVRVVFMASFKCPSCNEVQQSLTSFESTLGTDITFLPIPQSREDLTVALWLALKNLEDENILRHALFDIFHVMRMPDPRTEDLIEYIRIKGVLSGHEAIQELLKDPAIPKQMANIITFASQTGASTVPCFVILKNGRLHRYLERQGRPLADYIRDLQTAYKDAMK